MVSYGVIKYDKLLCILKVVQSINVTFTGTYIHRLQTHIPLNVHTIERVNFSLLYLYCSLVN